MITLFNTTSADGFVAAPDGSENFIPASAWKKFLVLCKKYDAIILGRGAYEAIQKYEKSELAKFEKLPIKKLVVSGKKNFTPRRGYKKVSSLRGVLRYGTNLLLCSGPTLNTAFMRAGLIDRMVINKLSVSIGRGLPIFYEISDTYTLVLDAGTTTIKAFVFDKNNEIIGEASMPTHKIHPHVGWVEQNPKKIITASIWAMRAALKNSKLSATQISSMGITNQRETVVAWDVATGTPIYNAIVWEDTRTAVACKKLAKHNSFVLAKSGHPIIPYFSATKIAWILKNIQLAKKLLSKNQLRVGTIDSWLIWNLCAGHPHTTDITNASRTLLMDAKKQVWDKELGAIFGVPLKILPKIHPTQSIFGKLKPEILSVAIPITAVIGDQQSSMHAARVFARQNKIRTPFAKITFGTGVFIMMDVQNNHNATEIKIENCAARVSKVLKNKKQLVKTLTNIAQEVAERLKDLPRKPTALIIDGGVTRDGLLKPILARATKLPVFQLKPYNGTALGAALLARK